MIIDQLLQVLNWIIRNIFDIMFAVAGVILLYKLWEWGAFKGIINSFRNLRDKRQSKVEGKIFIWDALQVLIDYLDEKVDGFDKKEFIERAELRTKLNKEKGNKNSQDCIN